MAILDPDLRRTWLFGPGADAIAHDAMLASGADALIVDLEDFTPRSGVERRALCWRGSSQAVASAAAWPPCASMRWRETVRPILPRRWRRGRM